jgi:hypothetical protein
MYNGFEMQHYNEDTWDKRTQLFDWLDEADYVFMASNRLYGSIARLPARYPLTTEYYRALFAGELGFELAADFTSRPACGPFQFPDQENPFPLMEAGYTYQTEPIVVHLPPAEEAFSRRMVIPASAWRRCWAGLTWSTLCTGLPPGRLPALLRT